MSRGKRRAERRQRRRPASSGPPAERRAALLETAAKLLVGSPYKEEGAALDALAGRAACPHGQWPHQGLCLRCAGSVVAAVVGTLGTLRPDVLDAVLRDPRS